MRKNAECNLPDELRCRRSDWKRWRCCQPRVEGSSYCEYHRDKLRSYGQRTYAKRRNPRNDGFQDSVNGSSRESMSNKRKKKEPEIAETSVLPDNPSEIGLPANYKKSKIITNCSEGLVIGITKQCVSGKYKISEPDIAETTVLPADIVALDDLRNVLSVETWREILTPAERNKLRTLLPKGQEHVVESLLKGDNFDFGNPVIKWGTNVCNGQQRPEALLQKEWELKLSQSQYFEDLKTYHHTFIVRIKELEQLCKSCNHNESKFLQELKQWKRNA